MVNDDHPRKVYTKLNMSDVPCNQQHVFNLGISYSASLNGEKQSQIRTATESKRNQKEQNTPAYKNEQGTIIPIKEFSYYIKVADESKICGLCLFAVVCYRMIKTF